MNKSFKRLDERPWQTVQQSGRLPKWNTVPWRTDIALNDGASVGLDLSGGYLDSSDFVKFGFPLAATVSMLSFQAIEYRAIFEEVGELNNVTRVIRWATDWMMACHANEDTYVAQVGDPKFDLASWQQFDGVNAASTRRPVSFIDPQNPGSDLAGEAAAAFTAASLALHASDPMYAAGLLAHGRQMYTFATTYLGSVNSSVPRLRGHYMSSGYGDELAWAATWLYKATGEYAYRRDLDTHIRQYAVTSNIRGLPPSWDQKAHLMCALAVRTLAADDAIVVDCDMRMWEWLKFDNKYGTIFTPGGMLYYENISDTGALRYALNSAWLAQMYADSPTTRGSHSAWRASAFAVRQLEYALGRNPIGMVFITGTEKSPVNISHRLAHGGNNINTPARNMHVIVGALLGGPNATDEYIDQRTNFKQAVPTLDYQAGFIGILASLINHQRADCLTTLHRILSLTTPFAALGLHIIYVCIRSWWNHRREVKARKSALAETSDAGLGEITSNEFMM